ncbi:MAG: hypothetical protein DWQ01_20785 [Planctomycetota bacterium]|nr:MAG: hypothetical protein DWQ01_20785 [Planctomycetota bacterium]
MPRFLSLAAAMFLCLLVLEEELWLGPACREVQAFLLLLPWAWSWRWVRICDRGGFPREAGIPTLLLLPVFLYSLFMIPAGGGRWLVGLNQQSPFLATWAGLAPFLWILAASHWGESALLGVPSGRRRRFVARQLVGQFLVMIPFSLVTQVHAWGRSLFPENAELEGGWPYLAVLALEVLPILLILPPVVMLLPKALGAVPGTSLWQQVVARMWRGRGRPPRVQDWDPGVALPNALALAVGPWRRILVSRSLQGMLRIEEMEAVLAHELSHLERRHGRSLLLGFLGAILLADIGLRWLWGSSLPWYWAWLPLVLAAFPFLLASRVFEMEADLDAAARDPSLEAGLVGALTLLGRRTQAIGFRHFSPSRRVAEIEWAGREPHRRAYWQRRAKLCRGIMRGLFLAGLAGLLGETL